MQPRRGEQRPRDRPASAGREGDETIILQAHTDMVCEKDEGVDFDFAKDALRLVVDGDTLRAEGTTLGADDGISVAMMLALADDAALSHPKLELLFTTDEEIGMLGAFRLRLLQAHGPPAHQPDSEYEGVLMCSCAGGANAYTTLPVKRERAELELLELSIGGLRSGHLRVEIDKGRANSNVLMARLLRELAAKADIRLVGLEGGARETAIAASTVAVVGAASGADALAALAEEFGAQLRREYATAEPDMSVSAAVSGKRSVDALTAADTSRALALLQALPDGVQAMSVDMPGLSRPRSTFGLVKLRDAELWCANTVRSSMTSQKRWILDKICAAAELAGGEHGDLRQLSRLVVQPQVRREGGHPERLPRALRPGASVEAVHAGIECGLFADSIPELDCVSIGPDMADVHTPREHLSIASAARTYELLKLCWPDAPREPARRREQKRTGPRTGPFCALCTAPGREKAPPCERRGRAAELCLSHHALGEHGARDLRKPGDVRADHEVAGLADLDAGVVGGVKMLFMMP